MAITRARIAVGLKIEWYEIKIIPECLRALYAAIDNYDGEVSVNICLNLGQNLEQIAEGSVDDIEAELHALLRPGEYDIFLTLKRDSTFSIADYRRQFNASHCNDYDLLVWYESDALMPSQMFVVLDRLHNQIPEAEYIITPASCKMWGPEWRVLEHPDFEERPFIENDTTNWWSLRYCMSYEEMEEINARRHDSEVLKMSTSIFNGCGLVMSSGLIRAGLNIPDTAFFVDDTPLLMLLKHHGVTQYVLKTLLMVHNRKHPLKRWNIKGEEDVDDKTDMGKLRARQSWYELARKFSDENAVNLFNPNYTPKGWKDVFKVL